MTLEEAIKLLKQYQGYDPMFPDGETLKHAFDLTDETVDTLLAALRPFSREQMERMKGVWIFNDDWWEFRCSECHKGIGNIEKYNFCPHCRAPMTDEAVDMVMERWKEALDNDN